METRTTVQITLPAMGESVTEGTVLEWRKQVGDQVEADAKEEGELVDVVVPSMGESVSEGTLLEWLVKVGDTVKQEQGLAEISTDKIYAELPSPVSGIVAEILAAPDETVRVGDVLCRISPMAVTATPQNGGAHQPEAKPVTAPAGNGDVNATPVAARIAADLGVDIASVKGSGPRGRITKDDVLAHANGGNGAAPALAAEAKPLRGPAATLARFMEQSRSLPTA